MHFWESPGRLLLASLVWPSGPPVMCVGLALRHQAGWGQNSVRNTTPDLQLLSQNISVISFLTPKGREFVTSWVANKQVQVPRAVSCPRALLVAGTWFSTKYSSGFAQGVAEKEIQNKEQACISHISSALSHVHFCFPFLLIHPSPLSCCRCTENWWIFYRRNHKCL